jgi:nitronate monooxygenase
LAPEAGTNAAHRAALATVTPTALTRAFTGRLARGLVNRFLLEHSDEAPIAYPWVHHATAPLRAEARRRGDADGFNLWAGQAHRLALDRSAADIVHILSDDARAALEHAAARLGDRVRALVVIGGALRWRPEAGPVFEERVRLARAGRMDEIAAAVAQTGLSERCRAANPALCGLFRELIASNVPDAYAEWSAATADAEMVEPRSVACPTLCVCGELDNVTPPAFAEAIASVIPNARTAVIEGAAHWCHLEAPDAVNAVILGFLDEIAT